MRTQPYSLTAFGRQVVADNLGLAGRAARRLGRDLDADDAMGEACVALCRAVAAHDPARGALSTLAGWTARSRFHELSRARSRRVTFTQDAPDFLLENLPAPHEPDPGDALDLRDAVATLAAALAKLARLRPLDADLLRRHYLGGVTQAALAAELGLKRKTIGMRFAAARRRLRKILEGEPS